MLASFHHRSSWANCAVTQGSPVMLKSLPQIWLTCRALHFAKVATPRVYLPTVIDNQFVLMVVAPN